MPQHGLADYLRSLSVRTNQIIKVCSDPNTREKLEAICFELTEKAEALEISVYCRPGISTVPQGHHTIAMTVTSRGGTARWCYGLMLAS